jgi:hypothetical protein
MLLRNVSRACGVRLAAALACDFRISAKRSHRVVFEDKRPVAGGARKKVLELQTEEPFRRVTSW